MKALSIRQPWAWLIVNGHKDLRILQETYYRESAADIAKRL